MISTYFIIIFTFNFYALVYSHPYQRDSIVLDYSNYHHFEPNGDGTYSFGYEIEDPESQNIQFRDEERGDEGIVKGSYGWVQPDGNIIMVRYIADKNGYRAKVENTQGTSKVYGYPVPDDFNDELLTSNIIGGLVNKQNVLEQRNRPKNLEKNGDKSGNLLRKELDNNI